MLKFFKKIASFIVFPSLFAVAAFPFSCSLAKDSGIYKTDDYGASWQQKVTVSKKENIASKNILSMAIDPLNSDILFIGTKGSGFWRSIDGSDTWQQVVDRNNILQSGDDIYDIQISKKNPNFIYLAIYGGGFGRVLRSQDGGQSWEEIYVISQGSMPAYKIAINYFNDADIYVGTAQGGFLESKDYGSSWQPLKWFEGPVSDIKIDPGNEQIIYSNVTGKGIYKSTDKGQNWQSLVNSMKDFSGADKIGTLLIDVQDMRILYASLNDSLLVSYDVGGTWQKINILIPARSATISALAQDPTNSQIIYYSAGSVFYKTINHGQTWMTQQIPSSKKVSLIKVDPLFPNIIYVGMKQK